MCEKAREVGNYAKASNQAGMRANVLIGGIARLKPAQECFGDANEQELSNQSTGAINLDGSAFLNQDLCPS
jgi:hypothetical protein